MTPSEKFLMDVAVLCAERSTCSRLRVGAVLADEDLITFVTGYNGGPKGGANRCARPDEGNCGCVHAEMNAVAKAVYGFHTRAFLTASPCELCAVLLVNAGVETLFYRDEYRDPTGLEILESAGVKIGRT